MSPGVGRLNRGDIGVDYRALVRSRTTLLVLSLVLVAACGGESKLAQSSVSAGLGTLAAATPASVTPPSSPATATATGVHTPPPPCGSTVLRAAARGPVGATAMMSMTVVVSNTGSSACRLSSPETVRLLDRAGVELARFDASRPDGVAPYVDLPPTPPGATDSPYDVPGTAYVWLVWTWRTDTACHRLEPPDSTIRVAFPGGIQIDAPASIKLAPCSRSHQIAGFGPVPG
jgi:hypothetical protein